MVPPQDPGSLDMFKRLARLDDVTFDELERDLDDMVAQMQTPQAEAAADHFFRMGAEELGKAARRRADDKGG